MEKKVKSMNITFGYACNNNCIHCLVGYDARREFRDRSTEEIKQIIIDAKERDVEQIMFIGGEATIRNDFFELLGFAKKNGLKIHLESNGRAFSNKNFTRKTLSVMPEIDVAMSFHHADPGIQDRITRVKGSWEQSVKAMESLKKYGLKHLTVISVISRLNYENLPELAGFLGRMGVDEIDFTLMRIGGNAQKNLDSLFIGIEEIQPYLFKALGEEKIRSRTYGFPYCTIRGFEGHAYELDFIQTFLEDETYVFQEIFGEIDWQKERIGTKAKTKKCRSCKYFFVCEGIWREYIDLCADELRPVEGERVSPIEMIRISRR